MTASDVQKLARSYPRVIRWSDEDQLYIGALPGLCGYCTHGNTAEEVAKNLDECALLCVDREDNLPHPATLRNQKTNYTSSRAAVYIKSLREYHDLTQKELAEILGTNLSTLSKWESGARRPSGAVAKLLQVLVEHPELVSV